MVKLQPLHLLNRLQSRQTFVIGVAWNNLCWAEASVLAKKKPTTWHEVLPYLLLINQTKAVFLFVSRNSFTNVRLSCSVMAVTRQFEKRTQVAFSFCCLCHIGVCPVSKTCLPTWWLWLPAVPSSAGTLLCSADVMNQSLVAAVVYTSALWSILKFKSFLWLTRNVLHLLSVMPE